MDSQLKKTEFTFKGEADKLFLKAGTYMITDPCYVLDKRDSGYDLWGELCDQVFQDKMTGEQKQSGTIIIDGYEIWWGCTKFGDGGYSVMHNHFPVGEFGVDAGLFAIFPIEFVKAFKPEMMEGSNVSNGLVAILEMEGGLVEYSDGNMDCGMVFVTTDGTDQEEEEDDDWREEDEEEEEEEE